MSLRTSASVNRQPQPNHPHVRHLLRVGWIVLLVVLILLILAPKAGGRHHESLTLADQINENGSQAAYATR
jgi:hypothetical protein